jgi:hypothetical protein
MSHDRVAIVVNRELHRESNVPLPPGHGFGKEEGFKIESRLIAD